MQQSDGLEAGQPPVEPGALEFLLPIDGDGVADEASAVGRTAPVAEGPAGIVPYAQGDVDGSGGVRTWGKRVDLKSSAAGIGLGIGRHLAIGADELAVGIDLVAGVDFREGDGDLL